MADEEEEQQQEGEEEKPKKGKKKLIIILALVLVIGAGAAFALMGGGGSAEQVEGEEEAFVEEEEHGEMEMVDIGTFIVNLSQNATFLKVAITLECDAEVLHSVEGEAGGEGGEALPGILGVYEPKVKDAIIKVLSSKKAPQILGVDGKEELREEILDTVNEVVGLDQQLVHGVYFTHFIIQ